MYFLNKCVLSLLLSGSLSSLVTTDPTASPVDYIEGGFSEGCKYDVNLELDGTHCKKMELCDASKSSNYEAKKKECEAMGRKVFTYSFGMFCQRDVSDDNGKIVEVEKQILGATNQFFCLDKDKCNQGDVIEAVAGWKKGWEDDNDGGCEWIDASPTASPTAAPTASPVHYIEGGFGEGCKYHINLELDGTHCKKMELCDASKSSNYEAKKKECEAMGRKVFTYSFGMFCQRNVTDDNGKVVEVEKQILGATNQFFCLDKDKCNQGDVIEAVAGWKKGWEDDNDGVCEWIDATAAQTTALF